MVNADDPPHAGPELVLTLAAVERLQALIEDTGDPNRRLRIQVEGPANDPDYVFSFAEAANADDIELDYVHVTVLLDPESHRRLRGHELDHRQDERGEHFVIRLAGAGSGSGL